MRVSMLTELAVDDGNVTIGDQEIKGRRTRLALVWLLLNRHRPHPTSELADILWDGAPPPSWPSSLREVLSHVRRVLRAVGADGALTSRDRCLRLDLPEPVTIDVEDVLSVGERLRCDDLSAVEVIEHAAPLAVLQPSALLPEVQGSWANELRRQLDRVRVTALEQLGPAQLAEDRPAEALQTAEALLALCPLDESGHRTRVSALRRLGRRVDALQAYEHCRQLLVGELGVAPSPELQVLHQELLALDDAPAADRVGPPTCPGYDVPLAQREHELISIEQALAPGGPRRRRVVVVTGELGVGKTRLLHELVQRDLLPRGAVLYGRCIAGPSGAGGALQEAFRGWGLAADLPVEWAALDALAARSHMGATTILLDDVHLADEPTTRFIAQLVRRPAADDISLITTHRSDVRAGVGLKLVADLHRASRPVGISLEPLDARGLKQVATSVLGRSLPSDETNRLLAETGGIPLYVVEALHGLRAAPHAGARTSTCTTTVRAVVRGRLDLLSPAARQLLGAAAGVGRRFDPVEVATSLDGTPDGWMDVFRELLDHALIGFDAADDRLLCFRQDVVRRVLLEDAGAGQRRALRRRLTHRTVDLGDAGIVVLPTAG